MARQSEPATLVAIFSRGRVTIGKPAHSISVPVVCALHKGLKENKVHAHKTKKNYISEQLEAEQERGEGQLDANRKIKTQIKKIQVSNYESRNKSAKELLLMCSFFVATSVKII